MLLLGVALFIMTVFRTGKMNNSKARRTIYDVTKVITNIANVFVYKPWVPFCCPRASSLPFSITYDPIYVVLRFPHLRPIGKWFPSIARREAIFRETPLTLSRWTFQVTTRMKDRRWRLLILIFKKSFLTLKKYLTKIERKFFLIKRNVQIFQKILKKLYLY